MPIKIEDHFTPTYIRTSSFSPSGSKLASFSLFLLGFALVIFIFFFQFSVKWAECMWHARSNE